MRAIIFFLILAISVGAAFVTWRVTQQEEKKPEVQVVVEPKIIEKEVPSVEIVVARDDIPIGSMVKAEMLDKRAWPSNLVITGEDGFVLGEAMENEVVGRVARSTFLKGEPVIKSMLANPSDPSFLAAALKEGMRAVTIQIDGISGVAGFVYPGDLVDVLITHDIALPGTQINEQGRVMPNPQQTITEVLVSGIRVMAIDQRFASHTGQPPTPGQSVTLEVTPLEAQKLKLAEAKGKLSLSLKSLKKKDGPKKEQLARPIGTNDLSRVTPPSIFPVLYEGGDRVIPRTVMLAAAPEDELEEEASVGSPATKAEKKQDAVSTAPVVTKIEDVTGQDGVTTTSEVPAANVVIIRGTVRETEGVQ